MDGMEWVRTNRADRRAAALADRHYNRQHHGSRQFTPPGRVLVLVTADYSALWCSSFPQAAYVRHAWAGAWMCSCFRNESPLLSSALIAQAVAATRYYWGEPPALGMVTFVDPGKVRHKRDPGRCFRRAGWHVLGQTVGGLVALGLEPAALPAPQPAGGVQLALFDFDRSGAGCR